MSTPKRETRSYLDPAEVEDVGATFDDAGFQGGAGYDPTLDDAALVGKRWGRRRLRGRWLDGKKTAEGTLAMVAFATAAAFLTLLGYTGWPWHVCLAVAVLVAPVAALTELVTRNGMDTITVPFATFAWLLVVTRLLALAGVV